MVVLGGGAFSYERGIPVGPYIRPSQPLHPPKKASGRGLQGYLAHKKLPPPRTLQ